MKKSTDLVESHLRLSNVLFDLGRIDEAKVELALAKEIANKNQENGSQIDFEELQSSFDQVESSVDGSNRFKSKGWIGLMGLISCLAFGFFAAWMLSRATILELRNEDDAQVQMQGVVITELAEKSEEIFLSSTRAAEQVESKNSQIDVMAFELTQSVQMVTSSAESVRQFATLAAESSQKLSSDKPILQTVVFVATPTAGAALAQSTAGTPEPAQSTSESTTAAGTSANGSAIHRLRITEFLANFRSGPGFGYRVQTYLPQDAIVTALGYSNDYYWYYVEASDGSLGWVHSSLAKPINFIDELPIVNP